MDIKEFGWNNYFEERFKERALEQGATDVTVGRILIEAARIYTVFCSSGEVKAEVTGKLVHQASGKKDFPVVGDWVTLSGGSTSGGSSGEGSSDSNATIHTILPRKSAFTRKMAGKKTEAQVIAANIDVVFIVCGLDGDFNLSRIERYLTVAWESGAKPVIVLNKADVSEDPESAEVSVASIAPDVPVISVSAKKRLGLDLLHRYIAPGETVAFLGSSGVGKSSLINELLGTERQLVQEVREDDGRGRHTTRHGELFLLPEGGILMDTPGIRELQLWSDGDGLDRVFEDIEKLGGSCKFRDCAHDQEPGCAVRAALAEGTLSQRRWDSFQKMSTEISHLAARQDAQAKLVEKKNKKALSIKIKQHYEDPRSKKNRT